MENTTYRRQQSWPDDLHRHVMDRRDTGFAWGTHDCCMFAADSIQEITGVDPAPEFRGKYHTEAEAVALIKTITGGSTPEDAAVYVAQKNSFAELKNVLFAQRGDLVIYDSESGPVAGVVHLNGKDALFVGASGLFRQPLRKCRRAWRIS
jgi:hypothetical protein